MKSKDKDSLVGTMNKHLRQIAGDLLLNVNFLNNLGLLKGKMGVAIFLYSYSEYTRDEIYDRYATRLIDEIYDEINVGIPVDLANGFIGIGCGLMYLREKGFFEGDIDETLSELDEVIFDTCRKKLPLASNIDILLEAGFYYQARIRIKGTGYDKFEVGLDDVFQKLEKTVKEERREVLKPFQINGLLWLGLNVIRSGLYCLIKVDVLLHCTVREYFNTIPFDPVEAAFLSNVLAEINELTEINELVVVSNQICSTQSSFQWDGTAPIEVFVKSAWYGLLFNTNVGANHSSVAARLCDSLPGFIGNKNPGLENGIAGIGMVLLKLINNIHSGVIVTQSFESKQNQFLL